MAASARRLWDGKAGPVLVVVAAILAFWYAMAVVLNAPQIRDRWAREGRSGAASELVAEAWAMERPVLPAPHQILVELKKTVLDLPATSRRSLLYHAGVTLSSTLLGFLLGTALGIALAVAIVHSPTLDRALLPWIVASQTVPILAIAPIIVVVLAAVGLTGLLPKALISTYLCFFPVTIGMVKGLRSPEPLQLELLRTWNADAGQVLRYLRFPASLPFLFASLKVAVSIALVGAIVGELPTGAVAGLGARLLTGSYYGQTVQIWAALVMASLLAALLVAAVGLAERLVRARLGGAA
ncbi:MAG: ABC transporter permease [Geminicoccaceae bacterium]|nr:ABC transporter permease [Geminicoccaceae bacterium]